MRTSLQTVVPVRLQVGTVGQLQTHINAAGAEISALTADTVGGPETRLTTHVLAELRTSAQRDARFWATIADLRTTRKGRKKLRAMEKRHKKKIPITY